MRTKIIPTNITYQVKVLVVKADQNTPLPEREDIIREGTKMAVVADSYTIIEKGLGVIIIDNAFPLDVTIER